MVDYDKARDCEHGRQIGKCGDCEYQDLLGELSDVRDELAAATAQRDELLAALKIVTTGTVQTLMKRNKEWKSLVAKCEVQNA